jgi:alkylation response protein AidB-like acyl-CoA dehydrogenase
MTEVASPERLLFASTARAFLDKEASLGRVRELHASGTSFDADWWQRAAELGWASMLVPEDLGGGSVSGDGVADLALIAEQIGKTVAPGPLHPVNIVLAGLVDADNAQTHSATIESLVAGELVASWAVYEPGRAWAPGVTSVTATPTGSGFRIDGVKDRVEAGPESGLFLVVAESDGALRQFLVPADAAGVSVKTQKSLDLVKRYARVTFDGVEVDADAVVGTADQTPALIARQSQIAQILQCAEVVGILGIRLHRSVGDGPLLVRPSVGLLSGAQAQVRGHEDLAGGLPRHHQCRDRGGRRTGRRHRNGGERRQELHR